MVIGVRTVWILLIYLLLFFECESLEHLFLLSMCSGWHCPCYNSFAKMTENAKCAGTTHLWVMYSAVHCGLWLHIGVPFHFLSCMCVFISLSYFFLLLFAPSINMKEEKELPLCCGIKVLEDRLMIYSYFVRQTSFGSSSCFIGSMDPLSFFHLFFCFVFEKCVELVFLSTV